MSSQYRNCFCLRPDTDENQMFPAKYFRIANVFFSFSFQIIPKSIKENQKCFLVEPSAQGSSFTQMLSGFMSPCTQPALCITFKAYKTCTPKSNANAKSSSPERTLERMNFIRDSPLCSMFISAILSVSFSEITLGMFCSPAQKSSIFYYGLSSST